LLGSTAFEVSLADPREIYNLLYKIDSEDYIGQKPRSYTLFSSGCSDVQSCSTSHCFVTNSRGKVGVADNLYPREHPLCTVHLQFTGRPFCLIKNIFFYFGRERLSLRKRHVTKYFISLKSEMKNNRYIIAKESSSRAVIIKRNLKIRKCFFEHHLNWKIEAHREIKFINYHYWTTVQG